MWFAAGLFVGAFAGVLVVALLVAAKDPEDRL
jgi:hypothetical protein